MIDQSQIAALKAGRLSDPFALLGPHLIDGDWYLRAHVPGAAQLWVLEWENGIHLQEAPGQEGFFTVPLQGPEYRLRAADSNGTIWEFDDPYRFAPLLGEIDEYLIGEGRHQRLWQVLGAHLIRHQGVDGVHFALWAPSALRVSLVGDFNLWNGLAHPMRPRGQTGVWEIFIPDLGEGIHYKYEILGADGLLQPLKADPFGFGAEHAPQTASVVRSLPKPKDHGAWMEERAARNSISAPISIYEVHLPSWRRAEGGRALSYLELAEALVDYAAWMGFTHIELLPISEYPFEGSWGYQPVGLYAPTVRHGTPDELAALVAAAHRKGLGILLDWVPGHFPTDAHGLGHFDGTPLYEHSDPKEGFHQDWNTLIYNYGRREVRNFLTSNALYWLEEYGFDGLRVDAVASMLYRDYSREPGEWVPNKDGGRENYEAIAMLQEMNCLTYGQVDGILTAAEESTSFDGVTRPVDQGGLGFGFKWNLGWMNDSLRYMALDPIHRKYHHNLMTFAMAYAYSENFILPLSHDEVVHGKGSLIAKMAGEGADKFANLRAYFGFMWGHPGKKLLFMGQEFAQWREWDHQSALDWSLCDQPLHRGIQLWVRDLNLMLCQNPALHHDSDPSGFEWLLVDEAELSVFAWARRGAGDQIVVITNMTPVERHIRLPLPQAGEWNEILNSDSALYGGQDRGNCGKLLAEPIAWGGQAHSAMIFLPPLSAIYLKAPCAM